MERFMRNCLIFIFAIVLFFSGEINAQTNQQSIEKKVSHPEILRVSAYEAYSKYKEGKALIFHGGGERYNKRHILNAPNLDVEESLMDRILVKFPKQGIEIFTYCY
jgi:hypothetical protein